MIEQLKIALNTVAAVEEEGKGADDGHKVEANDGDEANVEDSRVNESEQETDDQNEDNGKEDAKTVNENENASVTNNNNAVAAVPLAPSKKSKIAKPPSAAAAANISLSREEKIDGANGAKKPRIMSKEEVAGGSDEKSKSSFLARKSYDPKQSLSQKKPLSYKPYTGPIRNVYKGKK